MKFHFNLGKPFRPFEQLMGVLPEASKEHIPAAYRVGADLTFHNLRLMLALGPYV